MTVLADRRRGDLLDCFADRRPLPAIGGLYAYLRQVRWSLRWHLTWRRRIRDGIERRGK